MTITIYTTTDFPYGGAPENFVRQMALGLDAANANINIVLLRGHYLEKSCNTTGIKCSWLLFKNKTINELFKFIEVFLLILSIPVSVIRNRIQRKTKVVILYGVEYFYFVLPFYFVGKLLRIKIYRVITDRYPEKGIAPTWWKKPKIFFYQLQYKYLDKYLAGIICLSYYLKETAINYGVEVRNIFLVPHFINIDHFSDEASKTIPFSREHTRIGFCGTLNEGNGLLVLLKAFNILMEKGTFGNIKLFLIGRISEEYLIKARELMGGNLDSIVFTGHVNGKSIPKLLAESDILVNPRISSTFADAGFPTKLGEYLATRRPVVATSVGDLKHYFGNKNCLFLADADSPESLAEGIMIILKDKMAALQMGEQGYKWAIENLEYRKNGYKLLQFLNV